MDRSTRLPSAFDPWHLPFSKEYSILHRTTHSCSASVSLSISEHHRALAGPGVSDKVVGRVSLFPFVIRQLEKPRLLQWLSFGGPWACRFGLSMTSPFAWFCGIRKWSGCSLRSRSRSSILRNLGHTMMIGCCWSRRIGCFASRGRRASGWSCPRIRPSNGPFVSRIGIQAGVLIFERSQEMQSTWQLRALRSSTSRIPWAWRAMSQRRSL